MFLGHKYPAYNPVEFKYSAYKLPKERFFHKDKNSDGISPPPRNYPPPFQLTPFPRLTI